MTTVDALKGLKNFLEKEVASSIKLQKEDSVPPEYVNPYVAIIALPHKNFVPTNFQVPNICIGLNEGGEDYDEHTISVRLQFATYGGDTEFGNEMLPDETGYLDLLNVIERTKQKLTQVAVIPEAGLVEKSFKYGIYNEELTYPYWYGYLEIKMQLPVDNRQMIEEFL